MAEDETSRANRALDDDQPNLWGTWWVFDEPKRYSIFERAQESLQAFLEKMHPLAVVRAGLEDDQCLFMARYEFPTPGEDYRHPDGVLQGKSSSEVLGFIDFMVGFPYGDIEILGIVGEVSTKEGKVAVKDGGGAAAPEMPDDLFEGFEEGKIIMNLMWLAEDHVDPLAQNLSGTEDTENPHWWLRYNIIDKKAKWPTPGEFLFLAIRLFPTSPWGSQDSNPFLYAGNWMDTLWYTNARVTDVIEATAQIPYKQYKVQWRDQEVTATPSDFTEYAKDDRVAIIKNPDPDKKSHTWELNDKGEKVDPDKGEQFDVEKWMIVPVSFYEKEDT